MKHRGRTRVFVIAATAVALIPLGSETRAQSASAPDTLAPNKVVTGQVAPGTPRSYSLRLNSGDYVGGSITQHGQTTISIYLPDRSFLRRFSAPTADGKRTFAFSAETAGDYRIELDASDKPAQYELRLDDVANLDERLKPAWTDPNPSPRIEALRRQIVREHVGTEAFWKKVAEEGTPLVEPFGSDGKYQLVTFLWRATLDTRNVLVLGSFEVPWHTQLDYVMHRLADTDVWYLTLKLPKGARFEYALSPNDPLVLDGTRAVQRRATRQADPLNPHRWDCLPADSKFACSSLAELPGAEPQPWIVKKKGTPEGKVETQQIKSEIQKLERSISVYTPPGYQPNGPPNPLLVLFDGPDYLDDGTAMPTTMNNLIAASKIPPTVAVLVSNVAGRRLKDLVANPEFADFMAKELLPWVRAHYNVTKDPAQTVVGGFSAGGLAATYMGLRYPDVFGNVLSQSGAVWWSPEHDLDNLHDRDTTSESNWMAKQFVASPKLAVKFYIEAGTFEADTTGRGSDILEASRQLRDVLLAKGCEVHYHQFVGGHDGASWRGTLADGLIALIGIK
jgi:enterochelin esterase family protein